MSLLSLLINWTCPCWIKVWIFVTSYYSMVVYDKIVSCPFRLFKIVYWQHSRAVDPEIAVLVDHFQMLFVSLSSFFSLIRVEQWCIKQIFHAQTFLNIAFRRTLYSVLILFTLTRLQNVLMAPTNAQSCATMLRPIDCSTVVHSGI